MNAEEIVEQCNDVLVAPDVAHDVPNEDQVNARSHVGLPMAQMIVGHLVLNNCRHGLLTSGTRTRFVHTAQENNKDVVRIGDVCFIGQHNCLRSIAAMCNLALNDRSPRSLTSGKKQQGWLRLTPDAMKTGRNQKRAKRPRLVEDPGRQRPQTRGMNRQNEPAVADIAFPTNSLDVQRIGTVDFEEIEIKTGMGCGRCGTCFLVQLKNGEVALKFLTQRNLVGQKLLKRKQKRVFTSKVPGGSSLRNLVLCQKLLGQCF